jgi:esterase
VLLRSWRGPATLIHGSLSDYVRPQHRPAIAQAFPAMGLVEIEGAGHWVHVDRPVELIAALDLVPAVEA